MGAKRPEPPPFQWERFDADSYASPHPPPKREPVIGRDEEHPRFINELLAERDDLRRQLAESREREKKIKCPVCKAPSDQHGGGSPEIALLQQNLANVKSQLAESHDRERELLAACKSAEWYGCDPISFAKIQAVLRDCGEGEGD